MSVGSKMLEAGEEFVMSTAEGINTIGDGIAGAILHPIDTASKIVDVVAHPIESAKSVGHAVTTVAEHIGDATVHTYDVLVDPNASAGDKAKVATRAVLEVGTLFIGVGGAKSLATGASVTSKAMNVERVVFAAGARQQRVLEAMAAADLRLAGSSSSPLARELNKVAQVPHVTDVALSEILNGDHALFRPSATVGNGGTAAAVRHTKETATLVGNTDHIEKLAQKQTELAKWLVKNANDASVSAHDVSVARNLLQETIDTQAQLHSALPHVENAAKASLLARGDRDPSDINGRREQLELECAAAFDTDDTDRIEKINAELLELNGEPAKRLELDRAAAFDADDTARMEKINKELDAIEDSRRVVVDSTPQADESAAKHREEERAAERQRDERERQLEEI